MRVRVFTISRPRVPSPITPTLALGGLSSIFPLSGAFVCPSNRTPPSIVISVATDPPLRKSRRLNPSASLSFSFIRPFGALSLRFLWSLPRKLSGLEFEASVQLRTALFQSQRPFNSTEKVLLIRLADLLWVLSFETLRRSGVPHIFTMP